MTREEAWNRIDAIIEKHEVDDVYVTINNHKDYDALRFARKLLEQEPCEDAISRQAVLKIYNEWFNSCNIADKKESPKAQINALPPVLPRPKTEVFDKIRAEIKEESKFCPLTEGLERALEIIDKYTKESEDKG